MRTPSLNSIEPRAARVGSLAAAPVIEREDVIAGQ